MRRLKSKFKISNYLSYVHYRLKDKYSYKTINDVVSLYQKLLRKDIEDGNNVSFLYGLGDLEIGKVKKDVYIDDNGNIVNKLPINKNKTLQLWREKPELRNKRFIYYVNEHTEGYLFCITYRLSKAKFKNKSIYLFMKNSRLKRKFSENIKEGKIEAFLKN